MNPSLPLQYRSDDSPPDLIYGYVSVEGEKAISDSFSEKSLKNTTPYHAKKGDRNTVRRDLEKSGFEITAESPLGFSVVAPAAAYEDLTGGKVEMVERLMQAE